MSKIIPSAGVALAAALAGSLGDQKTIYNIHTAHRFDLDYAPLGFLDAPLGFLDGPAPVVRTGKPSDQRKKRQRAAQRRARRITRNKAR